VPFLLRCIVSRADFRRLGEFYPRGRAWDHERLVYVWPTSTLRDVANLLYLADPALSRPLTTHDFRVLYYHTDADEYETSAPVTGVTRVAPAQVEALLHPPPGDTDADASVLLRSADRRGSVRRDPPTEVAARRTLRELGVTSDTILECALDAATRIHRPHRRERSPPRRRR